MPTEIEIPYRSGIPCRPREIRGIGASVTQVAIEHDRKLVSLNVDELRPGDVILCRKAGGSAKSAVAFYQGWLFSAEAAVWTHCAILDENFGVWEATPSRNVTVKPLREFLREPGFIAVVRPRVAPDPTRLRVSLLQLSNHDYRIFKINTGGRLAARLLGAVALPLIAYMFSIARSPDDDAVICSLFAVTVLRRACQHGFLGDVPIALPADFVTHSDFGRVTLDWVEVHP